MTPVGWEPPPGAVWSDATGWIMPLTPNVSTERPWEYIGPAEPSERASVAWFYGVMLGRAPTPHEAAERLLEELNELFVALTEGATDVEILKEIQDVRYTLAGYELARGWDGERAFALVHASNMTKEPTPSGKVRKGVAYVAPDLGECIGGERTTTMPEQNEAERAVGEARAEMRAALAEEGNP